jgi:uncharacterized Fe-S cluster-containing radical SAM superfamily protein
MVHVDISNVCNFRCIHCPQGNPDKWVDRKPSFMLKDHFFKIVDEVSRHRSLLRITSDGEPLIHPDIIEMLSYILDSDVYAGTITTNGSIMDQQVIDLLVRPSKIKFVIDFSLDAFYRRTYEKIRRGGNFITTLKNILKILDERNRQKASHLYILVNAIDQQTASQEIGLFNTFWEQLVDQVIIRKYVDVKGLVGNLSGAMACPPPKRWPCVLLWSRIMVNTRGELRFCIDDWNNETVFHEKNVDNTTIADIWRSDEYNIVRKDQLRGIFTHVACSSCRNWEGLKWDYDYRVVLNSLLGKRQLH